MAITILVGYTISILYQCDSNSKYNANVFIYTYFNSILVRFKQANPLGIINSHGFQFYISAIQTQFFHSYILLFSYFNSILVRFKPVKFVDCPYSLIQISILYQCDSNTQIYNAKGNCLYFNSILVRFKQSCACAVAWQIRISILYQCDSNWITVTSPWSAMAISILYQCDSNSPYYSQSQIYQHFNSILVRFKHFTSSDTFAVSQFQFYISAIQTTMSIFQDVPLHSYFNSILVRFKLVQEHYFRRKD